MELSVLSVAIAAIATVFAVLAAWAAAEGVAVMRATLDIGRLSHQQERLQRLLAALWDLSSATRRALEISKHADIYRSELRASDSNPRRDEWIARHRPAFEDWQRTDAATRAFIESRPQLQHTSPEALATVEQIRSVFEDAAAGPVLTWPGAAELTRLVSDLDVLTSVIAYEIDVLDTQINDCATQGRLLRRRGSASRRRNSQEHDS